MLIVNNISEMYYVVLGGKNSFGLDVRARALSNICTNCHLTRGQARGMIANTYSS